MANDIIQVGVDVGGTNTDIQLVRGDDEEIYKLPTTEDPSISSAQGVAEVCELAGVAPEDVDTVLHGTTVATNALIENEGAETGMLTTRGFRDVIHIGRHRKEHTFSILFEQTQQTNPIVPRRHRKTITERIYPPGEVIRPLDEDEVLEAAQELVDDGVESVAVCYLHSYLNTAHEDRTKELIQEEFPELTVSTSNEVVNQFREYERFSSTAINARLAPVMNQYLTRLEERLAEQGMDVDLQIMQSSGGLASVRQVTRKPITTLLSGPAGGVLSGQLSGEYADESKLITLDMGGTSADISVVPERLLERDSRDAEVGNYPTVTNMLDIETIGSGGGSIAWFDSAGGFNVGPKSAGSEPGPACLGQGGENPTITDAQLVLGRIDPEYFLGGEIDIDVDLARAAIEEQLVDEDSPGGRFSTVERAALSTLEVANSNMSQATREQTIRRGYDARDYTLVAFGGAGPLHAADIAEELDMTKVLVPPAPGIASARGLLTGDIQYDNQVTISQRLEDVDEDDVTERFEALRKRGRDQLLADGIDEDRIQLEESIDMLYEGQGFELNVPFDGVEGDWRGRHRERFEQRHETEYGHFFEDDPIELLNLRVSARAESHPYEPMTIGAGGDLADAERGTSTVYFGDSRDAQTYDVTRYDRAKLGADTVVEGPAIVDSTDSTLVIKPDWTATVLPTRAILMTHQE
ncbi:MAG: hydantoinase/oxoprolinase family protein [Haloarculaceae archaeon]